MKKNLLLNIKIRSVWSLIESIIKRCNLPEHPELWHLLWFQWPLQLDLKWQMQKHRLHMIRRDGLESYEGEQCPWLYMAANILCKEIVHKAFQASFFVSATPIAMPSKTEWKHKATINKMLSPTEPAGAREWCTVHLLRHTSNILIQS